MSNSPSATRVLFDQAYPIRDMAGHFRVRCVLIADRGKDTASCNWTVTAPNFRSVFRSSGTDIPQAIFNGFVTLAFRIVTWEQETGLQGEYFFMPHEELHRMVGYFRSTGLER
jgi:hypothetical protein